MSLPFVVQQTIRLMNPSTTTRPAEQLSDPIAAPTFEQATADPDVHRPAAGGEPLPATTAPKAELLAGDAKVWSRLRDYEADEAQAISQRLLTRQQHTCDCYHPDGALLFTDRYIQRFGEEEERSKREAADWTRNLDPSTARFRADAKERDTADASRQQRSHKQQRLSTHDDATAHADDDIDDDEEEEADGDANYQGYDVASQTNQHQQQQQPQQQHHHHSMRSSLSSVGRALGRKVKFSSSKIASSLGGRRAHRKEKGKEAATDHLYGGGGYDGYGGYGGYDDYGYGYGQQQLQAAEAAYAGLGFVPGTGVGGVGGVDFPLFTASARTADVEQPPPPLFGQPSAATAASSVDLEKTWGRDYSPFSPLAFGPRQPEQQHHQQHHQQEEDDQELPPLEDPNP